jgi:hypothetical protein
MQDGAGSVSPPVPPGGLTTPAPDGTSPDSEEADSGEEDQSWWRETFLQTRRDVVEQNLAESIREDFRELTSLLGGKYCE